MGYIGNQPSPTPIQAGDIADNIITAAKIVDGAVGFAELGATLDGAVVQRVYSEILTNVDITTVMPYDDTIPQITEGVEILTAAITPRSATNRIRIRFQAPHSNTAATANGAALFVDATANALAAVAQHLIAAGSSDEMALEYEEVAASITARTYRIRVGPASNTMRLNGTGTTRIFGGKQRATLVVEELKA